MSSFEQISRGQDASLVFAAFELALDEYPELPVADYARFLDHIADEFRRQTQGITQADIILEQLGDFFFGELEFTGNTENYYDPRNSYLNDVIDRRMGIPISLSVLYQFLAERAGVRLDGVNFPGHFLLMLEDQGERTYIDVFQDGRRLTWEDCEERLIQTHGGEIVVHENDMAPLSKRGILMRMLRNLKGIYSRGDLGRCLRVQERIARLAGGDPSEMRDLGILYFHTGKPSLAVQTLDKLVREHPEFREERIVESYLSRAAREAILLN